MYAAMSIDNMLNNAFLNEKIVFRNIFKNDKCDNVFWINHYIQQQFNYQNQSFITKVKKHNQNE